MISGYARTQQLFFSHLTRENGLVNNRVNTIFQDKQGYIWIGTQSGLQRYDGTRFINYLADLHDSTALQNDWISTIFEDSRNRLWIGTDRGSTFIFNRATASFKDAGTIKDNPGRKLKGVWHFCEDKSGDIWVADRMGFYKFDNRSLQFETKNDFLKISGKPAYGYVSMDHSGNLWFATIDGIKELDLKTQKVYTRDNNPLHLAIFDIKETINNIEFDAAGNAWISTGYDFILYKFDMPNNKLQSFSFKKPAEQQIDATTQFEVIGSVFISASDKIMIPLLSRGIAIYDTLQKDFVIEEANQGLSYKLHIDGFGLIYLTEDREQNIWVGTNAGISIFNSKSQHFTTHSFDEHSSVKYLSNKPVSGFIQTSNGDILVGYYAPNGGFVRFDKELHFKDHLLYNNTNKPSSRATQLWSLFEDHNGIVWAPNQEQKHSAA